MTWDTEPLLVCLLISVGYIMHSGWISHYFSQEMEDRVPAVRIPVCTYKIDIKLFLKLR